MDDAGKAKDDLKLPLEEELAAAVRGGEAKQSRGTTDATRERRTFPRRTQPSDAARRGGWRPLAFAAAAPAAFLSLAAN